MAIENKNKPAEQDDEELIHQVAPLSAEERKKMDIFFVFLGIGAILLMWFISYKLF
ncbi:MAG: hypothetical protein AAB842_01725 [Patescibacteria group bacterium]